MPAPIFPLRVCAHTVTSAAGAGKAALLAAMREGRTALTVNDFGVAPLPTFGGAPLTISAPDTWTLFDNGKRRAKAAVEFVQWLNQPAQDARWVVDAGSLPLRKGTAQEPKWKAYQEKTPGLSVFVSALDGARTKPTDPLYPQVSEQVGQSLVAVLLKRSSPTDALDKAVQGADGVLAGGG